MRWNKSLSTFAVCGSLALGGGLYTLSSTPPVMAEGYGDKDMKDKKDKKAGDLVAVAMANEDFSTLVAAVKAAGLVETLQGEGPFTIFAPTNEAFAALPAGTLESLLEPANKEKLQSILTYHVVAGKVKSKDVATGSVPTVQGGTLDVQVSDGKVMINDANVTKTDIYASNGVIHVIDKVLLPSE